MATPSTWPQNTFIWSNSQQDLLKDNSVNAKVECSKTIRLNKSDFITTPELSTIHDTLETLLQSSKSCNNGLENTIELPKNLESVKNLKSNSLLSHELLEEKNELIMNEDARQFPIEDHFDLKSKATGNLATDLIVGHSESQLTTESNIINKILEQISDINHLPQIPPSQVSSVLSELERHQQQVVPNVCLPVETTINCSSKSTEYLDTHKRKHSSNNLIDISPNKSGSILQNKLNDASPNFKNYLQMNPIRIEPSTSVSGICPAEFEIPALPTYVSCSDCLFLTLSSDRMKHHSVTCKGKNAELYFLKCLGCENKFLSPNSLKSHLIFDHGVSNSEAAQLVDRELSMVQFMIKEKTVAEEKKKKHVINKQHDTLGNKKIKLPRAKKFKCDLNCNFRFMTYANLEYHKACHDGTQWKCPECEKIFPAWNKLVMHLWSVHEIDIDLFKCDLCSYKTYSYSELINFHKGKHSEERPHLCDLCGKGFKTKKQLNKHKDVHRAKNNSRDANDVHECSLCQCQFPDNKHLKAHIRAVHNQKQTPYLCSTCGHQAVTKDGFKMHVRTHTGEKPYKCTDCNYETSDHNSMRRHKMIHSGLKHYSCPHCDYACIQSQQFKNHLNFKHPGMHDGLLFRCHICQFKTIRKEMFLIHVSGHVHNSANKEQQNTNNQQTSDQNVTSLPAMTLNVAMPN